MSQQARDALANNPKMRYTAASQRDDLRDPKKTNTYLIAMLEWLVDNLWTPILVLAVKTDHSPTGQHYDGCALDMYPGNWQTNEKQTCVDMMTALAKCPFVEAVGLGGVTKGWAGSVAWKQPGSQYSILFEDNSSDHLHAACANNVDWPGRRAQSIGYTKYTG